MSACAYPTLVVVLILAIYGVYLSNNLLPQASAIEDENGDYFYRPSEAEFVSIMVIFHFLLSMLLLCFTLATIRSPGYIPLETAEDERKWIHGDIAKRIAPEDEATIKRVIQDLGTDLNNSELIKMLKSMPVVERKKRYGYHRHCSACNLYKPDRTHHCRVCDRCVLRMDHHCPWIANCVGFGNYKHFLLLLFYAILTCIFLMGSMFRRLIYAFRPIDDNVDFLLEDLPVCVTFLLCLFLTVALTMFFAFHMNLVLNAMTTIELREKKNNDDPFIKHRFYVAHIKFDRGKWGNFLHVFGPWYTWLLPIHAGGDGTYSEVDDLREDATTNKTSANLDAATFVDTSDPYMETDTKYKHVPQMEE